MGGLTMKKEVQDALETAIAGFEKRQDAERSSLAPSPSFYLGFSTALARLSSR